MALLDLEDNQARRSTLERLVRLSASHGSVGTQSLCCGSGSAAAFLFEYASFAGDESQRSQVEAGWLGETQRSDLRFEVGEDPGLYKPLLFRGQLGLGLLCLRMVGKVPDWATAYLPSGGMGR